MNKDDKEDDFIKHLRREKSISEYFYKDKFWNEHFNRLEKEHAETEKKFKYFLTKYNILLDSLIGESIPFCIDVLTEALLTVETEYQSNPENHQNGFRQK